MSAEKNRQDEYLFSFFFFQAEDGIRDLVRSRGLGDVYKRQEEFKAEYRIRFPGRDAESLTDEDLLREVMNTVGLSLIHI